MFLCATQIFIFSLITLIFPITAMAQSLPFDRHMGQNQAALVAAEGQPDSIAKNWDVISILTYNHKKFGGRDYTVAYSLDNDRVFSVHCSDNQRESAPSATLPPGGNLLSFIGQTKDQVVATLGAPQQFSWTRPASHDNFAEEAMLYDRLMLNGQPLNLRLTMENGRVYWLQYQTVSPVATGDGQAWLAAQVADLENMLDTPAWLRYETDSSWGAAYENNDGESWWAEGYLVDDRSVCWYTASTDNGGLNLLLSFWDVSAHGAKIEQEKNLLRELMQEAWYKEDWERGGELSHFAPLIEITTVAP